MGMNTTDDEQLQRYFDGDLSSTESSSIEAAQNAEVSQELAKLEQLSTLIKGASTQWSGSLDSDALFARIESEVGIGQDDQSAVRDRTPAPRPSSRARRSGRGAWAGAAMGLAAAAAVFLAVFALPGEKPAGTNDGSAPIATAHLGSEVVEVDFGPNTGTVFEVEGAAGQPLAVVWIDDEEVGLP